MSKAEERWTDHLKDQILKHTSCSLSNGDRKSETALFCAALRLFTTVSCPNPKTPSAKDPFADEVKSCNLLLEAKTRDNFG